MKYILILALLIGCREKHLEPKKDAFQPSYFDNDLHAWVAIPYLDSAHTQLDTGFIRLVSRHGNRVAYFGIDSDNEMVAFTDSVNKAHSWRIDSAIYYFTRNHECYYKALQYGREGRKKLLDIYSDSTEYYNTQLQKLAQ